jgi:hypothetical protein
MQDDAMDLIYQTQTNIDRLQFMIGLLYDIKQKTIESGNVDHDLLKNFYEKMTLANYGSGSLSDVKPVFVLN